MHTLARSAWVRELHSELRAAGLHNGYAEGISCFLSGHDHHRTMVIAMGPSIYPRLVLDIREENLPDLHPPGYIAEFFLQQSAQATVPLGSTRIGPSITGIDAHFGKMTPTRFVHRLESLLVHDAA